MTMALISFARFVGSSTPPRLSLTVSASSRLGAPSGAGARGRALESKAAWYRGRAADCAKLAATAPTPEAKAMLEQMAARWLRLAELVEKGEEK